ncbi:MAG: cob(I)yrinic acid a,c-diamide adenosyltransferase [Oscillospiraceae bacterium]|nr:cob(I)yrinic acid a,c-diamide adenosyltransferase [Oscillospiraceae bacterium]
MLHLYYGDGKGKTSSAVGLGIRAAGRGFGVLMIQFLKCQPSGEVLFLKDCENFTVRRFESEHSFIMDTSESLNEKLKSEIAEAIAFAKNAVAAKACDVLILDEVLDAVDLGFVDEDELISLINIGKNDIELAFTGRRASDRLIERADYVTDLTQVKHPYQKGVIAREGFEY